MLKYGRVSLLRNEHFKSLAKLVSILKAEISTSIFKVNEKLEILVI